MAFHINIRRPLRQALGPVLWTLVVGYFSFHAVTGERSLWSWWQLRHEIKDAEGVLATAREERFALEHRVGLLRPESLDPDMLDEQVRRMLNLIGPDEVVILNPLGVAGE